MTIKELREQRAKLFEDSKAILNKADAEKRGLTTEESAQVNAIHADMDKAGAEVNLREKSEAEERALGESRGRQTETHTRTDAPEGPSEDDAEMAFRGWAVGPRRANAAMIAAADRCGLNIAGNEMEVKFRRRPDEHGVLRPQVRSVTFGGRELRALSEGTTTAGGNAVSDEMMRSYEDVQKWYGGVRTNAETIQTESGAPLPWPTVDDTGNTGEILTEGSAVTTTADPTFGQVILGAYKFSSKALIVSVELLQDSFIPLPSFLGTKLGERIGRIQNNKFTVGTGTGEPNGIVVASTLGKTAAATNAFTFDEVIDLVHSVDPAYRPRSSFMLHDTIVSVVRKLKDSQNRYLWEMSTQAGVPDRIFGYPVITNNDMSAALTTGQKLILFGEISQYKVRDAGSVIFLRADELRMLNHQVVFAAFQRSDGNLPVTSAVRHLKLA